MLSTSNVTPSSDGSSAMWVTTSVRCSWSDVGVDCVRVGVLGGAANAVRGEQDSSLEYEVVSVPAAYEAVQERLEQVANQVLLGGSRSGDCRMHRMALAIAGHSHGRSRVRLTARLLDRVQVRERGPCPRFGAWDAGVGSGSISTVRSRARVQAT